MSLMSWFERLLTVGPQFGYFPEPTKSYLVVSESSISRASDMSIILVLTLLLVAGFGWLYW